MVSGKDVCTKARELIGYPYVYGGNMPSKGGFDCSGLIEYVYKELGISIPRTTYDQINIGKKIIKKENLKEGDLIFNFDENNIPQHVMLYSGNGKVIEAMDEGTFVLEHSDWNFQGCAVRVLDNLEPTTPSYNTFYRVIAGSFRNRENAENQMNKLKNSGFNSFIAIYKTTDIIYRVVVGSYSDKENAQNAQSNLAKAGFDSFLLIFTKNN